MQRPTSVSPWLRLLRVPNLCTVPGDPIAGFMLAVAADHDGNPAQLLPCIAAAVLFYSAGLIINDCLDIEIDRAERPNRPLPSGRIDSATAWIAALIAAAAGLGLAAFSGPASAFTGMALLGSIFLYNQLFKRNRLSGALGMGACRALSLLLGASLCGAPAMTSVFVLAGMASLLIFIAAVTWIAAAETRTTQVGAIRWLPPIALFLGYAVIYTRTGPMLGTVFDEPASYLIPRLLAIIAVVWAARCGARLHGSPRPDEVSQTIGLWIRGLILHQAALTAILPWLGSWSALGLLIAWPLSRWLGRTYYSS